MWKCHISSTFREFTWRNPVQFLLSFSTPKSHSAYRGVTSARAGCVEAAPSVNCRLSGRSHRGLTFCRGQEMITIAERHAKVTQGR
jgi:hypothetical protein